MNKEHPGLTTFTINLVNLFVFDDGCTPTTYTLNTGHTEFATLRGDLLDIDISTQSSGSHEVTVEARAAAGQTATQVVFL